MRAMLGIGDVAPRAARRHVMVGDAEGQARLGHLAPARLELAEGVERALVHVVAVDPQQRLPSSRRDDLVGRPELVEQGQRLRSCLEMCRMSAARASDNIEGPAGPMLVSARAVRGRDPMSHRSSSVSRRRFLQIHRARRRRARRRPAARPSVLRAQGAAVKVGVLHPVSGALSYSGQQGRLGATLAIEEINAAGGIKALGGAKIEAVLGDAQSTPEGGNAEVEKMNAAGVAAIVGGYASGDLPCRQPDRGALRPALCRRRRRRRQHRHARPEEHVPLRPWLRRHRQDRDRQPRHHQRRRPASRPRR